MSDVQRLDYSKPPPGYRVEVDSLGIWGWEGGGGCFDSVVGEGDARASAWTHYKARNNPPGMTVIGEGGTAMANRPRPCRWRIHILGAPSRYYRETRSLACTEAWGLHDRRLALASKLEAALVVDDEAFRGRKILTVVPAGEAQHFDGEQRPYTAWPRCLTWSDDQVAAVERWLVDSTAEMPEVLRG